MYVGSNASFNMSDWSGEPMRQDVRWKRRMPPVNNANRILLLNVLI